ncbi:MAG: ATP-binding cassette domain-containing protein [Polyangiales bacterium]
MTVLSIHAPAIGYGSGAPVLRDVRLEAAEGECIALLGGNGAGKTALLHWIAGVLPRADGRRVVDGQPIDSPRAAVAAGVGLVVQDPDDQLLGATVGDDVEIGPRNLRLPDAEIAHRVVAALTDVGLALLATRTIETLSFGERKRASLAGVLAMRPKLLLLDEPTAGLDPVGELSLCASLAALTEQGRTMIVATHAVDLVPRFATRVVLLGEGRVLADGPCRELMMRDDLLARAHVRRPWPAELWARTTELRARTETPTLTLEEVLRCPTPASC